MGIIAMKAKTIDFMKPITREMADRLLLDKELQEYSTKSGADLGMIVNNLLLTLDERWSHHQRYHEMMLAFSNAIKK